MSDIARFGSDTSPILRRVPPRVVLAVALALGAAVGIAATGSAESAKAVANAGAELTRLLRAMAVIKVALAVAAAGAVDWRLRFPAGPAFKTGYLLGLASMAAGPGLIWSMAHVAAGACCCTADWRRSWRCCGATPAALRCLPGAKRVPGRRRFEGHGRSR